ncbi:MAG: ribosome small subunit-dependent GTPase A [Halobacteriovoraceae bacterium]|jgi:ribosome biogenesis GTPase / thiamine phosphate phosphatase|nr:ribosome small subunit-dependent GTPase A [Halobacteriovoraceae bacterium]MBT5095561.1 ribosome small subunit-dependent GTPase A [Halobacteriovoraceae bacterium]
MLGKLKRGKVYRSSARKFEVKLEGSDTLIVATALGKLVKGEKSVVVGDWVEVEEDLAKKQWTIMNVEKRHNEIFRLLVRENKKKVTAANCDLMVILNSVSKPAYKRGLVDRFLARAHQWNITPLVVFNKMDEHDPEKVDIPFERDRLLPLGVECFEYSAKFPDYQHQFLDKGISEFVERISGRTSIFLGQSGVGKSKTISALSDGKIVLKSKNIGKSGKGAHTTTWSEIVDCPNFQMVDSPGIRSYSMDDLNPAELIELFPDLEGHARNCKFNDCLHLEATKGCSFWEGMDLSTRESQMVHTRLESFRRIHQEISETPQWRKKNRS